MSGKIIQRPRSPLAIEVVLGSVQPETVGQQFYGHCFVDPGFTDDDLNVSAGAPLPQLLGCSQNVDTKSGFLDLQFR